MNKDKTNGWTTGRIIVASVTLIVIVLILSATAIVYGVSSTVGVAIKNNPELLSAAWMSNSASEQDIMTLLLAKYVKGGFDGTGQIDGSFTGRFTTVNARSLEKVNLSCVDEYDYQIVTTPQSPVGVFAANAVIGRNRFLDKGCAELGRFSPPDVFENGMIIAYNNSYVVVRCPLNNCAMREVDAEKAGEFIPEKVDIRKIQAGVSSQIGK